MEYSDTENVLQRVRDFAERAHGNQTRKYSDEPYIVHPERVMRLCRQYTNDLATLAGALLHDVLEDTPLGREAILNFLLPLLGRENALRTVQLVEELTDVYVKARYPHWNRRKRKDREARRIAQTSGDSQTIRYADIIDNSREIVRRDIQFAGVFLTECRNLLEKITQGDQRLYRRAVETVDSQLRQLEEKRRGRSSETC